MVLNGLLSVFVGALLALATIFSLEFLDRRVRTLDDIEGTLGLPVIGTMPANNNLPKRLSRGLNPLLSASGGSVASN